MKRITRTRVIGKTWRRKSRGRGAERKRAYDVVGRRAQFSTCEGNARGRKHRTRRKHDHRDTSQGGNIAATGAGSCSAARATASLWFWRRRRPRGQRIWWRRLQTSRGYGAQEWVPVKRVCHIKEARLMSSGGRTKRRRKGCFSVVIIKNEKVDSKYEKVELLTLNLKLWVWLVGFSLKSGTVIWW